MDAIKIDNLTKKYKKNIENQQIFEINALSLHPKMWKKAIFVRFEH